MQLIEENHTSMGVGAWEVVTHLYHISYLFSTQFEDSLANLYVNGELQLW